jgi:hypothetical protein
METSSIEYAAYVGLDWADREHPGVYSWRDIRRGRRASSPTLRKQLSSGPLSSHIDFRGARLLLRSSSLEAHFCLR